MCYSNCPYEMKGISPDLWGECNLRTRIIPRDAHCYEYYDEFDEYEGMSQTEIEYEKNLEKWDGE